jgi:predicted Zn-ribbon and HTH transcriptional regulator
MHKPRPTPAPRDATIREAIHDALLDGPLTARDLSQRVGIPERDVAGHLRHLERSLKHKGETLIVDAPACLACGFAFIHRQRHTKPGQCPQCRGRRISLPRFRVERRHDAIPE